MTDILEVEVLLSNFEGRDRVPVSEFLGIASMMMLENKFLGFEKHKQYETKLSDDFFAEDRMVYRRHRWRFTSNGCEYNGGPVCALTPFTPSRYAEHIAEALNRMEGATL